MAEEVKNAETFAVVQTPVAPVAPVVESPNLQALNSLLNDWYNALKSMVPRGKISPADQLKAGVTSLAITNLVCRVGSTELFDRLAAYYDEHRNDVCSNLVALAGNKGLNFNDARKVSFLYTAFRAIGTVHPVTISGASLTEITKCASLVPYLKSKNVRIV